MQKNFKRIVIFLIFLFQFCNSSFAVTRGEFLSGLLEARNIDWSASNEAKENNGAGFILRSGIVTDNITNLIQNVTRREALRWCIESLGLNFEAEIFSDMPLDFKDIKDLTRFERGCLYVASHMNPLIFVVSDNFRGDENLSNKEKDIILERVSNASQGLSLNVIRNPLKGLQALIHRDGVFSGVPSWRFYAEGIENKSQAENLRKNLKSQGLDLTLSQSGGRYLLRTAKIEDYNQIRQLTMIMQNRKLNYRILPSVANSRTAIVPKYWVMLFIDPSYWKIKPISSANGPRELSTLSQIAKTNNSKAALNAGFFAVTTAKRGYPIGALKIDGEFLSAPYEGRGCLGWNDEDEALFAISSHDVLSWDDMSNIIQAGPLMLDDGQILRNSEGFNNALISARHPRSAVGLADDGRWVFVAVDGRNGLHSSGATISELTEIFRTNNIPYALNLDGGGSTEIIINGKIYNSPSEGYERVISYALGALAID